MNWHTNGLAIKLPAVPGKIYGSMKALQPYLTALTYEFGAVHDPKLSSNLFRRHGNLKFKFSKWFLSIKQILQV